MSYAHLLLKLWSHTVVLSPFTSNMKSLLTVLLNYNLFPNPNRLIFIPCVYREHFLPVPPFLLAVSEVLGSKVCLSKDKYNTMCCLESEEIGWRITTDWQAAQVHVLPMMQLNFKVSLTTLKTSSTCFSHVSYKLRNAIFIICNFCCLRS